MISGINHLTFSVRNIERSFHFYKEILGCKPVIKWKTGAYLLAGDNWLALIQEDNSSVSIRKDYTHIAFTCENEVFSELRERILACGSQEWSENHSEGESLYFTDPDGHKLELHVGDLASRLKAIRETKTEGFEVFP